MGIRNVASHTLRASNFLNEYSECPGEYAQSEESTKETQQRAGTRWKNHKGPFRLPSLSGPSSIQAKPPKAQSPSKTRNWERNPFRVASAGACHIAVNGCRGSNYFPEAIRGRGGFFRRSYLLTNGQACFLTGSYPGSIRSSSTVFNMLSRICTEEKQFALMI